MWQTKYPLAVPKNLGVGVNFRPCSEGYFLCGRPQSVHESKFQKLKRNIFPMKSISQNCREHENKFQKSNFVSLDWKFDNPYYQNSRKREVALARISLYIVLVFLLCHIIRIIPNAYEMIQSYNLGVSMIFYQLYLETGSIDFYSKINSRLSLTFKRVVKNWASFQKLNNVFLNLKLS